ncbi:MAG: hypothetical protein MK202_01970 [Tenacibaculum sp.]|nr:hypothetical protein [Tenacibaculum sp.]
MKKYIITLKLTLLLFISCNQKKTEKTENIKSVKKALKIDNKIIENKKDSNSQKKQKTNQIQNTIPDQYFENDSLLDLFETDLDKLPLNLKFELLAKPKTNNFDETVIDTIKKYTFDKTIIYSYKATNWESIYFAKIENSVFKFLDSLSVGTKKQSFENLLKTELNTDLVKIGNLEQTSVFSFTFENERLKTIEYDGYVD